MNTKTGTVIIAKDIKIDKDYKNVLSYTNNEMIALLRSNDHLVYEKNNCSFLRDKRQLILDITYNQAVTSNYIAFQNPDYSNKWFFGFIDSVEYHSEKSTIINYTVDEWTTWFDDWDPKQAFIIREHVTDDSIGANTVPENLELGEYIANGTTYVEPELTQFVYVLTCSMWATSDDTPLNTNFGGVIQAGGAYVCETPRILQNVIQSFASNGRSDAINNVYIVPKKIINITEGNLQYDGQESPVAWSRIFNIPTDIDGYIPKNNKLFTSPFQYLLVYNGNGTSNTLYYELSNKDSKAIQINYYGVPTIGASIIAVPMDYKKQAISIEEALMAGKFPTLSWSEDAFTNWLTQNAVNIGIGVAQNTLNIVGGIGLLATGGGVAGASMLASAGVSIASQISQVYQHSLVPYVSKGNTNGGDIMTSFGANSFSFTPMSIKNEYAKIIDDYFTAYGYKVNRLKKPNIKTRKIFNYLQISNESDIGYGSVPNASMLIINNIARAGVTIWHNHSTIGTYTGDNSNIS